MRDAHLARIDPYLLPLMQRRRWTQTELGQYCEEQRRLRFLDPALIQRWLETADERGVVRRYMGSSGGRQVYWEVTDRGYQRDFNLLWKLIGVPARSRRSSGSFSD